LGNVPGVGQCFDTDDGWQKRNVIPNKRMPLIPKMFCPGVGHMAVSKWVYV